MHTCVLYIITLISFNLFIKTFQMRTTDKPKKKKCNHTFRWVP